MNKNKIHKTKQKKKLNQQTQNKKQKNKRNNPKTSKEKKLKHHQKLKRNNTRKNSPESKQQKKLYPPIPKCAEDEMRFLTLKQNKLYRNTSQEKEKTKNKPNPKETLHHQ